MIGKNIYFDHKYYNKERKEYFQRDGIVLSHYIIKKLFDSDHPKELIGMIQITYNNFTFKRDQTRDCLGINIYQGTK